MPARLSSMELSDPATSNVTGNNAAPNRRKSSRTKQKPVLLQEDPSLLYVSNGSSKRKRADTRGGDAASLQEDASDESSPEESDGDPDEEELKEKRRRASRSKKISSKPVAKKAKITNALSTKLAVRPAMNGVKKAPKPRQPRARSQNGASDIGTGLYGMLGYLSSLELQLLILESGNILLSAHFGWSGGRLDDALWAASG